MLLHRIEGAGAGISLMHVSSMLSQGKPPHGTISTIVAIGLQFAGVKVSVEDVLEEVINGDAGKVFTAYNDIVEAVSPAPRNEKKPEAQSGKS